MRACNISTHFWAQLRKFVRGTSAAQELPITIPELATMGPSWAPDGTEVVGSSSSSVFRVDALTGQRLRGYREAGGRLAQGESGDDSPKAGSALGEAPAEASHEGRAPEALEQ